MTLSPDAHNQTIKPLSPENTPLIAGAWSEYSLLDSGHGRKLERYGKIIVDRPEPQALWSPTLPEKDWQKAVARFTNSGDDDGDSGKWQYQGKTPDEWPVEWDGLKFVCRLMSFRHMGLFPEQQSHWQWVNARIAAARKPLNILNLFAYTGAATLSAAKAGASVTHLDASKKAIQWAKDNQSASGLEQAPIRWICDDAKEFVAREIRRGKKYDGIILDPPKFGRGPDGQRWQLEQDFTPFLQDCVKLLSDDASFMIVTAYAMRLSALSLASVLHDMLKGHGGSIGYGELLIEQENKQRYLPTSLYARWSA